MDEIEKLATAMAALGDQPFRDIVDDDLRRRGDDREDWTTGQVLRHPMVVERFYTELLRLGKSIEGQLATIEADYRSREARLQQKLGIAHSQTKRPGASEEDREKAHGKVVNLTADILKNKSEYMADRGKKLRFKTGLDMTTLEVRYLVDSLRPPYESLVGEERNHFSARCRLLESAIRDHQTSVLEDSSVEPAPADEKLWDVLSREPVR